MSTRAQDWVYGDFAPDPESRDLTGLKARWIVDRLPPEPDLQEPNLHVLDFGCGEGKHLHLVRKVRPRAALFGVDIVAPRQAGDFTFQKIDQDVRLPFPDESFDVVISCDVLEHVGSIEQCLREIKRVLKDGGSFIGFVPTEGGIKPHSFFRLFKPNLYAETKDHINHYTRRSITGLFSKYFSVVAYEYSYHVFGATLDAVFFAAFKLPRLGPKLEAYWRGSENVVYRKNDSPRRQSALGKAVNAASTLAYYESRALRRVHVGAIGLQFHLKKAPSLSPQQKSGDTENAQPSLARTA